jgi:hypothetical protein
VTVGKHKFIELNLAKNSADFRGLPQACEQLRVFDRRTTRVAILWASSDG